MTEISMPRLSDSMEEGTVLSWLKADGDDVDEGEELVEIETDKATMTYESPAAGALRIVAAEGDTVAVGEPIAQVGAAAEAETPDAETPDVRPRPPAAEEEPPPLPGGEDEQPTVGSVPASDIDAGAAARHDGHRNGSLPAEVAATPLARRLARLHGIDLGQVSGTGPRGRITRGDVAAKAGLALSPPAAPPRAAAPAEARALQPAGARASAEARAPQPAGARGEETLESLTRLQQVVARRMTEAKATVPHFQVETEAVMDAAVELRSTLKAAAGDAPVPSFNDLIVKATALALRAHPRANGSFREGGFALYSRVNVGVAVAAQDALVVPTITDADRRSIGDIAAETRRLAERVREGTITPPELSGATFTVSNLGMFGMTAITPVIDPPQVGILGVGALRDVLARVEGDIVDRKLLTLTLSCDHRMLYGADAALVLSDVRERLEDPVRLLL